MPQAGRDKGKRTTIGDTLGKVRQVFDRSRARKDVAVVGQGVDGGPLG